MAATTLAGAFAQGPHSARPAASSSLEGYCYFETDTNGGTLFQCKSSAWVQLTTGITAISAVGLTGAVAASRYAGGTTSGAPASGTFAKGDFVIDQTGVVWVCTVAGTPGTWVSASGSGVTSITGTAHQVIASASTGAVTLSTPQGIDTTSSPTFASLDLGGLTGAVAGGRFVGFVASGAPASGTFLTNDVAFDVAGNKLWLCTAGGSPGTWTAGGDSLTTVSAYLGSDVTMTTAGTNYDGPSVSCVAGTWILQGGILLKPGAASSYFGVTLWDGTTHVSDTLVPAASTAFSYPGFIAAKVGPGSTTTYKITAQGADNSGAIKANPTHVYTSGNFGSYLVGVKVA